MANPEITPEIVEMYGVLENLRTRFRNKGNNLFFELETVRLVTEDLRLRSFTTLTEEARLLINERVVEAEELILQMARGRVGLTIDRVSRVVDLIIS